MLDGPFRGSKAIAAGLITPNVLRGPRYHRPLPDVYAPAACEPSLAVRSRAAYLWLDGKGVLGGYSAAELYAARCTPIGHTGRGRYPRGRSTTTAGTHRATRPAGPR